MNIWIFNHYAIGPGSSGGTRHYDLAKELVEKGHHVTIFASSFNHQALKEEHIEGSKQIYIKKSYNGVDFIWIKTPPYQKNDKNRVFNMLSYSKKAYSVAKGITQNPDIVIGSLVHPLAAFIGYLVSRKKKATFYFEERDLWPQTLIDLGKISEKHPAIYGMAAIEKFLYRKSKRTIVLFDKAVDYVVGKGIKKEKVLYIPNGVDLNRMTSSYHLPEELCNVINEHKNETIAVYTGTHGVANNLDAVLNAAKIVKERQGNVHFLLVGNGPEKPRLLKRKQEEGLHNVSFFDPIPKELIPSLLNQCDLGLLPLQDSPVFKWGISPNKLFDYMGSSLPVALLCNLEGTPIEKANGGFVIKDNFSSNLAEVVLNTSKERLSKLGENARYYVEVEHSWKKLSRKLERVMLLDINGKP